MFVKYVIFVGSVGFHFDPAGFGPIVVEGLGAMRPGSLMDHLAKDAANKARDMKRTRTTKQHKRAARAEKAYHDAMRLLLEAIIDKASEQGTPVNRNQLSVPSYPILES
jgi:2-phosphoglycerate kinase